MGNDKRHTGVSMDIQMKEDLKKHCKSKRMSVSYFIRELIWKELYEKSEDE